MNRSRRSAVRTVTVAVVTMVLVTAGLLTATRLFARPGASPRAAAPPAAVVRIDQVGYTPGGSKIAYAMLTTRAPRVRFTVRDRGGRILGGVSSPSLGRWNARYAAVYRLDFTELRRVGAYRIELDTADRARSLWFRIAPAAALFKSLVRNAVRYFTSERDGANIDPAILNRRPANLTDRRATVYAAPHYDSNDTLLDTVLHPVAGPVDVAGGWFDAGGGYEKFGYTASYSDALMSLAALQDGGGDRTLPAEARFGLSWLQRLWDPVKKVAYIQVGIGSGGATIAGDYDHWFLPQQEDALGTKPGDADYYVQYRPVFRAAAPGAPISPGLAGRYAAAFALGAQLDARSDPAAARHLLYLARTVYAQARTRGVGSVLTTYPHDYYPATQWKSDMAWGATEIALADHSLHASCARTRADLTGAGRWGRAYLAQSRAHRDTFNLYDDGAVAEAELIRAQRVLGGRPVLPVSRLLGDLAAQLRVGERAAAGDPFALGTTLGAGDTTPHAFGLFITDALFRRYGGGNQYAAFAQQQLDFVLGANAWGVSFVVGAGRTFPHCMQSEIANLAGSLTGTGQVQLGAVVNGPSAPGNFVGLGTGDGMRACSFGSYAPFDYSSAAYRDDVVAWPSVEPADDYTANSLLAFVLAAHA